MTAKQAERASSAGCPGCGGTDVDLKLELAPPIDKRRPARRARPPAAEKATSTGRLRKLLLARIYANPDQPRKEFKEAELYELAASITTHGLLQAIRVRPDGAGRYMIIAGERRYRAHLLAGLTTISAHVDDVDDATIIEQSIVENLQRVDITPLEEARAFQTALEMSVQGCHGEGDPVALAQRLGLKQPWRITERLSLLNLREDHQELLAHGTLSPSQGYEMSRLPPALQDELLKLIRRGTCDSYARLRATTEGLLLRESQGELLPPADPVTAEEQEALSGLERLVEKLCGLLARSFDNKQMVIVKKIAPHRAGVVADQIKLITKHLAKMEKALRSSAVAMIQVEAAA
ncbi:MAG: ParB/RepB/Spo0J family partition protein [Actinomycetota bacterium]